MSERVDHYIAFKILKCFWSFQHFFHCGFKGFSALTVVDDFTHFRVPKFLPQKEIPQNVSWFLLFKCSFQGFTNRVGHTKKTCYSWCNSFKRGKNPSQNWKFNPKSVSTYLFLKVDVFKLEKNSNRKQNKKNNRNKIVLFTFLLLSQCRGHRSGSLFWKT